jgi:periplasmic nitrate reductase NapD
MAAVDGDILHIASAVVHARPERTPAVAGRITAEVEGAEVHYAEAGKIIVTFEAASTAEVAECLARVARLDGVYVANLVYHEVADRDALGESPCS